MTRATGGGDRWHETGVLAAAARQGGLVTTAQALAAGLTEDALKAQVASGWLRRIHRGIYVCGPIDPPWMPERAALLACGDAAGLSCGSAGAVLGMLREAPAIVEVSVTGHRRAPAGVRVRRVARLETTVRHRMRVTTPIATLHDLARVLPAAELARAIEQAQLLKLVTHAQLTASLTSRPSPALRDALYTEAGFTRSEAERRLRGIVRRGGLPTPEANQRIAGHEVDALWREQRLVVEVDGFTFHGTRAAFERDRRRDADLQAAGYRVLRFTWRQLTRQPELVAARIAAALAASA